MQVDKTKFKKLQQNGNIKIAMITNIPSPYREEIHNILHGYFSKSYHVYYCALIEPHRHWIITDGTYEKTYLKKSIIKSKAKPVYLNIDILKELGTFNPHIIITGSFNPTQLLAILWAKLRGKKHIAFTDGTLFSEKDLSLIHKCIRKIVFRYTDAFIGASKKSLDLYKSYKISNEKLFLSPLCIDNKFYSQGRKVQKNYDIIFSGQFIERKMPFFFIQVVKLINASFPCKVLIIGSGKLKEAILRKFEELNIDYAYPGFIQQSQLPTFYGSAKVLLFPTKYDAWGVVANEACAVGLPVITCENAGAADELIINNYNGYVLPLDEHLWAKHAIAILSNSELYNKLSENALTKVQEYNHKSAAQGIIDAIKYAVNH